MTGSQNTSDVLISELADDPDFADLVEMFVSELPNRVAALQRGIADQDYQALASLAHQLKGSAGGYGFPSITAAAALVEQSARTASDLAQLTPKLRQLTDLCARARARAGD